MKTLKYFINLFAQYFRINYVFNLNLFLANIN
jgi:hypothetical protein